MLKIKANEELFDEWKLLGFKVGDLNVIVQNNMELSEEEVNNWYKLINTIINQIKITREKTISHIRLNNKKRN